MSAEGADPVSSSPIRAEALVDSAGEEELLKTPEKTAPAGVGEEALPRTPATATPAGVGEEALPRTPEKTAPAGVGGAPTPRLLPPTVPTPDLPPDSTTSDSPTSELNGASGGAPERPAPGDPQPNSLSSAEPTSTSAAVPAAPSPGAAASELPSSTIPAPNIPEPVIKPPAPLNGVPKPAKRPARSLQGNLDQIVRKLSGVADPTRTPNGHADNKTEPRERPTPDNGAFDGPKSALDLTTGRREDDDDGQFKAVRWGIMKKSDVVKEPRKKAPTKKAPSAPQAPTPENFAPPPPPPPLQLLRIPQYVPQTQHDPKFRSEIRMSGLAGGATVVHAQNPLPSTEEKKLYDKRFEVRPTALVNPFPGGEASSSRGPFPGAARSFPGAAVDVEMSRAFDLSGVVNGAAQPWSAPLNLAEPDLEKMRVQSFAGKRGPRRQAQQTGVVAEFHKALASAFAASRAAPGAACAAAGEMCAAPGAACAAPVAPRAPPTGLSLPLRPPTAPSRVRGAAKRKRGSLKNMLVQMVGQSGGTQTDVPVLHQLLGSKSQPPDSFSMANMLGGSGGAVSVTTVDGPRNAPVTDPSVVDRLKRLGTVIEVEEEPNPPPVKEPPPGAPSALKMLEKMTIDPPQSPVVSALDDRPLYLGKDISVYAKKKGTSFIHPSPNSPLSIIPVAPSAPTPVMSAPTPVMSAQPPVMVEQKAAPQSKVQPKAPSAKTHHTKAPPQAHPQPTVPHLPLLTITKAASKPPQVAPEPNPSLPTSQVVQHPIVTVTKTTSTSTSTAIDLESDEEIRPIEKPTETPSVGGPADYVPLPFLEPVIVLDEEESPLSSDGTYIFKHDSSHSVELPNDQKVFSCDICSAAFHHLHMLRKHYFRLHVARKYISEKDLEAYNIDPEKADDCNDENMYRCHTCRQCLPTKAELKSHLTDHPPVADLNKHIKGAKDYRCGRCNAHFKWRKMFGKHKKICRAPVSASPTSVPEKQVSSKVTVDLVSDESPSKDEPITAVTELALRQVIDTRAVRNLHRNAKAFKQLKPKRKTRQTVAMAIHSPPEVPEADGFNFSEEKHDMPSDPPLGTPIAPEEQNDKTESNSTSTPSIREPFVSEEPMLPKVPETSPVEEAQSESTASLNESSAVQCVVMGESPAEQVETDGDKQSDINQECSQEKEEVVTNELISEVSSVIADKTIIDVEVEKKSDDSVSIVNERMDQGSGPPNNDIAKANETPVAEPAESVEEPNESVEESAESVEELAESVGEPAESAEAAEPVAEIAEPVMEATVSIASVDPPVVESSSMAKTETAAAPKPAPPAPEKVDVKGLAHCLYCNETFNHGNKKRNHTLSQHPYVRKNHPCVFCKMNSTSFKTNVELFHHLLAAHATLYFACQSCKERFYSLDDLRDHSSKRHILDSSELKELDARKSEVAEEATTFTCTACQRIWLFKSCFLDHKCNPEKDKPNSDKATRLPKLRKVKTMERSDRSDKPMRVDPETMFYSQVSFNVRNNLLHFLDGKLPQDEDDEEIEDESAAKAPERNMLSFSAGFPGSGLQLIPEPEPYSRVKAQWEKYNFPKNYDGRCGLTSYIKDMSYLDISTQLIMRRNLQRLQGDSEVTSPTAADDVPSVLALERLATQCAESFGINGIPGGDGETTLGELSGEWVRDRVYVCSVCKWETPCLWTMEDHKYEVHPQVLCPQHELVGDQRSLANTIYKRVLPVEDVPFSPEKPHLRSTPVTKVPCTKCGMDGFVSRPELHIHVLACAGEPIPQWAPTPRKKRWKKRRRPRRCLKRNIPSTPHRPIKVRTKPGDTDTIQKMIANLPAKRSTRRVIGFDEADLKTRSQSTIQNITDFQGPVLLPSSRLVLPPSQASNQKHAKPSSKGSPKTSKDLLLAAPPHVPKGTDLIDTSAERGDVLSSLRMMPVSTPREELLEPRQIIDKVLGVQSEEAAGHPCTGCGHTSESKNALRKHQKICAYFRECGPNAEHKCKACSRLFDSLIALIEHSCDEMPKLEIEKDLSPVNSAEIPVLSPVQYDGKKGDGEAPKPSQICGVSFVNGKISYETVESIGMAGELDTNLKRKRSHSLGDIPSGKKMFRTGHRRSARLGQAEPGSVETPENPAKSEVPVENVPPAVDEDMYESAPEARLATGKNKNKKLPTRSERSKNDVAKKPDINRQVLEIKALEQSMSKAALSPSVESESFLDDDSLWEKQAVVAISEDETTKSDCLEKKTLAGEKTVKNVEESKAEPLKSSDNENKPKPKRKRPKNLRFSTKKKYRKVAKGKLSRKVVSSSGDTKNSIPSNVQAVVIDEAHAEVKVEDVDGDLLETVKVEVEIKNEENDGSQDLDSSKAVAAAESTGAEKKKSKSTKKLSHKVPLTTSPVTETNPSDVVGTSSETEPSKSMEMKKSKKGKSVMKGKVVVRLKSKNGKLGPKGKIVKVKVPKTPKNLMSSEKQKKQKDILSYLNKTPPAVKEKPDEQQNTEDSKKGNGGEDHISMSIDAVASGTADTLVAIMKTNDLSGLLDLVDEEMDLILKTSGSEEAEKSSSLESGVTSNGVADNKNAAAAKKNASKAKKKKTPAAEVANKSHVTGSKEVVVLETKETVEVKQVASKKVGKKPNKKKSVSAVDETPNVQDLGEGGTVDSKLKPSQNQKKSKKKKLPVEEASVSSTEIEKGFTDVGEALHVQDLNHGCIANELKPEIKPSQSRKKNQKPEEAVVKHKELGNESIAAAGETLLGHNLDDGSIPNDVKPEIKSAQSRKKIKKQSLPVGDSVEKQNEKEKECFTAVDEALLTNHLNEGSIANDTKPEIKPAQNRKKSKKQPLSVEEVVKHHEPEKECTTDVYETSLVHNLNEGSITNDMKSEIKSAQSRKKSKKQSLPGEEKWNEIEENSVVAGILVAEDEKADVNEGQLDLGEANQSVDKAVENDKQVSKKKGKKRGKVSQTVNDEEEDESTEIEKPVLRKRSVKSTLMAELVEEVMLGLDSEELFQEELSVRTTRSKRSSRKQNLETGDAEKAQEFVEAQQEGSGEITDDKDPEIIPRVTRRQYKKEVGGTNAKEIIPEPKELAEFEPPSETVVENAEAIYSDNIEQIVEDEDEPVVKKLASVKLKKSTQKSHKKKGPVAAIDDEKKEESTEATNDNHKKASIDATIDGVINDYDRTLGILVEDNTDPLPNDVAEMSDKGKKSKKRPGKKVDTEVEADEIRPNIFYKRTSVTGDEVESKCDEVSRDIDPPVEVEAPSVEGPKPKKQAGKKAKRSFKDAEESKDVPVFDSAQGDASESVKTSPGLLQKSEILDSKDTAPVTAETNPGVEETSGNDQHARKETEDQKVGVKPADSASDLKGKPSGEVTKTQESTPQVKPNIPFKNKLLSGRLPSAEKAAALLSRKPVHQVDPPPSEEPKKRKIFSYQKKSLPARRLTRSNSNGKSDTKGEPVIDPYDYNEDEIVPFQEPRYKPYSPPKPVLYAPPPAKRRVRKREDSPDTTTIVVQAEVHPEPPPRRRPDVSASPNDKTTAKLNDHVPTTTEQVQPVKRKSTSPSDKESAFVDKKKPKMGTCYDGIDVLEDEDSGSLPPQLVPLDEPIFGMTTPDRLNDSEPEKVPKPLKVSQWAKIDSPLRSASPGRKEELPSRTLSSRGSTPTGVSSPRRMASPGRISSPARMVSPARVASPAKMASPSRVASPARVSSPARMASPARVSSPALVTSPSRVIPIHTSLPLRSYGRVSKPMSPPSEPPELVDESKVTVEEKFDADSSSPILQPAAGPLSDLFDPEPPALERTGDLAAISKNTSISEEDTETAVDTEEDTDSMKSYKTFKKGKGKDLKLKMKKQLMRLKALNNKKKKDLKKAVGGTRKEVVKISGMDWEVSELATSPAKSEPPPPPAPVAKEVGHPIIKDWDASDLWDSPIVNAVPISAPGPVPVPGMGMSGSPSDPSPTHPSMPPLPSPSPAPRTQRSDSSGSTTIPGIGLIIDSVNKLVEEPENVFSSLPLQYSLADLQRAMGASDAEMVVLQQLGEQASCLADFDESLRPVVGNSHLDDNWIMDLDNQAAQQPIVSSSVVESPPAGTPPPEVVSSQSLPLSSSASNSSSSSSISNQFQSRVYGNEFSGFLRQTSSMCRSTNRPSKCGSSALLAAHSHKEVVCPTCSCHFMGFPALQIHVNKVHGSHHDPTQVTGSLQNRRVGLESSRSTSRLVCFECNQILPSHLMYRHLELDHGLQPGLVSRCSTVTGDLHEGPVVGERLKSKMSSALDDLLSKAMANILTSKSKPDASSTPSAPGLNRNAVELLNRLFAARKRDTSRTNSKDMSFNKLKMSEPGPVKADDEWARPFSSRPFLCTICGQRFPLAASRNKHEALAHKAYRNQNKMNLNDDEYFDDDDDDWRDAPSPESAFDDGGGSSLTPTCSDCGLSFDSVSELMKHRVEDHAPRRRLSNASEAATDSAAPVSSSTAPSPLAPRRISCASRSQSLDTTSTPFDAVADSDDSCSTIGTKSAAGAPPASGTNSPIGTSSSPLGANSSTHVDQSSPVELPPAPKKSRPRSSKINSTPVSKIKAEAALRQLNSPR